jgi:8-oxo-dGTP pyrophosphatase MutT (NUDIX family)
MIYKSEPKNFSSKFDVVSCFVEVDGKILLLHRQDHKPQGNTWGVPAGKVDKDEDLFKAMVREMSEETGYTAVANELQYFDKLFVRYGDYDFIYHVFHLPLQEKPEIKIHPKEHKTHLWETPENALLMNLIQDEDTCIKMFYKIS